MNAQSKQILAVLLSVSVMATAALACGGPAASPTSTPTVKTATPVGAVTQAPQAQPVATKESKPATVATVAPTSAPKLSNLGDVIEQNKYFIQAITVEDPAMFLIN